MRKHDLTNKNTMAKTKTMTKTMTNAFREQLRGAIFGNCDQITKNQYYDEGLFLFTSEFAHFATLLM